MRPRGKCILVITMMALIGILLISCDSGEERKKIDLKDRISDAELRKMAPKRDPNVLKFAFDLRSSPEEDARQYLPFLKYLTKATGYTFELRFMLKREGALAALGRDKIQFVALGAGSYIVAHAKYGVVPVVRGISELGKAEYQSVIFVAPDSPIQKIEDLVGKRFAFEEKRNKCELAKTFSIL